MHFRQLLLSGLLVGSVMFLPDNAFAERNEFSGQQNSQKASVQVNPSVENNHAAVKPNILEKEKAVVELNPVNIHVEVKQQRSEVSPNHAVSKKPASALQNLPEQAKGDVKSALNKAEHAVKFLEPKQKAVVQENDNGLGKNKPIERNNSVTSSALDSLHNSETEVKTHDQSVKLEIRDEDTNNISVGNDEASSKHVVKTPQKKGDAPSGEKKMPKGSQNSNPTQRTTTNGGQSNDRVNSGLNTINFLDKWFVWNPYNGIQLVQAYHSRNTWLNNQWVNAPPSPPPQIAPLLETVTRR